MSNVIRVTIWNEFRHEQNTRGKPQEIYPKGMHMAIADYLITA